MIVAVTGGRDFQHSHVVYNAMVELCRDATLLVHGGARGVDTFAAEAAASLGIPTLEFQADWDTHGRAAGPLRNQRMVDFGPDLLIAFPGGRGTADMVRRCAKAGIRTVQLTDADVARHFFGDEPEPVSSR